jgi:hypothetical protein
MEPALKSCQESTGAGFQIFWVQLDDQADDFQSKERLGSIFGVNSVTF